MPTSSFTTANSIPNRPQGQMRRAHTTTVPRINMKTCVFVLLSSFAATQAQAQDPLTSTFPSLSIPSLPSTLPSLSPIIPNLLSETLPAPTQQPSTPTQTPTPSLATPATPSPPLAFSKWQVLPAGVPRTKSGKPIPCSPKNTKLNPATHKLISECVETMFCAAPPGAPANATGLGVCFPRVCRRDEFPFGYVIPDLGSTRRRKKLAAAAAVGAGGGGGGNGTTAAAVAELPPMCAPGQFCPDDGSGCRGQVGIGAVCELDRDDQCQSPPLESGLKEADNKAVCLNKICMAATLPLGAPCIIENTTYVGDVNRGTAGGGQFTTVVIKHNCLAPGLFCDPTPPDADITGATCQPSKKLGEKCRFDVECESTNCSTPGNRCAVPPETPTRIEAWQWAVTVLFVVASLTSAILGLLLLQKRRRFKHYQHLQSYFYEQISLRRSILALHTAAAEQQLLNKASAAKSE